MPEVDDGAAVVTATLLLSYNPRRQQCWCVSCNPPTGSAIPVLERHGESISEALTALSEAVEEWEDMADLTDDVEEDFG